MRAVWRYEVPVDDQWHVIELSVPVRVLGVTARRVDVVEFWALHGDDTPLVPRRYRVFGTGHPLPDGALTHVGAAVTVGGSLVWHLFEDMNWGP